MAAPGDATNPKVLERVASLGWTFEPPAIRSSSCRCRASSAPRSGRRSTPSGRCCSARSSTSTTPRPRSSPSSSSTATTTTCRCSTSRTWRRRSTTSRRTRASRSSPTTAGCRRASVGVLLRSIVVLEQEGADIFFGEPEFEVADLLRTTPEGEGIVSILELSDVMDKPRLFSTFMLWMLAQLYDSAARGRRPARSPSCASSSTRRTCSSTTRREALLDQIERTARLIRSKGVGVYFVTQAPTDVPSSGPRPARQPRPARAPRVHARRRRRAAQDRPDLPDDDLLRRREDDHVARARARRWSRSCRRGACRRRWRRRGSCRPTR